MTGAINEETIFDIYYYCYNLRHHALSGHSLMWWRNISHLVLNYYNYYYWNKTKTTWKSKNCVETKWKSQTSAPFVEKSCYFMGFWNKHFKATISSNKDRLKYGDSYPFYKISLIIVRNVCVKNGRNIISPNLFHFFSKNVNRHDKRWY